MRHTGVILTCPRCRDPLGHMQEFRFRRFVPVGTANDLEDKLEKAEKRAELLATWIEENVEGASVYRDRGLVVT